MSRVVAGSVCYPAIAKIASMADIGRRAAVRIKHGVQRGSGV
ncbi:hypothetical protein [Mesorhizobium delmotii]|nr:hypothetical protein [Mesorhizobium delmotii]